MTDAERAERYKAEAKALLWDDWNKGLSKDIARDVVLKRDHPDLVCPPEYRSFAGQRALREVTYDVTVERDGSISKIERTKPSGSAYLDGQIQKALEHQNGKFPFPPESELDKRVIHYRYGWNVKAGGVTYPTGQVEVGGKLQPDKSKTTR